MTWISLKEFAELAYTNAESFFLKGVNALLNFTNGYGAFAIAVALIIFIALFFKTSDIVMTIVGISSPRVVEATEILAIHVWMLLTAFIFFKWFKPIYVFVSTILGTAASFGVITFFAFKITDYTVKITLVACAIGAIVGLIFCANQLKEHKHDFNRPPCKRCAKENKKKAKAAAKKAKKNNKKAKAAA